MRRLPPRRRSRNRFVRETGHALWLLLMGEVMPRSPGARPSALEVRELADEIEWLYLPVLRRLAYRMAALKARDVARMMGEPGWREAEMEAFGQPTLRIMDGGTKGVTQDGRCPDSVRPVLDRQEAARAPRSRRSRKAKG